MLLRTVPRHSSWYCGRQSCTGVSTGAIISHGSFTVMIGNLGNRARRAFAATANPVPQ